MNFHVQTFFFAQVYLVHCISDIINLKYYEPVMIIYVLLMNLENILFNRHFDAY